MSTADVGGKRWGRFRSLWLTLGVISGLAAAAVGYQYLPHYDPVRLEAWNKVEPRLHETDEATRNEVNTSIQQVKQFFARRKQNARSFAAYVLSLGGKWAYIKGYFQEGNHESLLSAHHDRDFSEYPLA